MSVIITVIAWPELYLYLQGGQHWGRVYLGQCVNHQVVCTVQNTGTSTTWCHLERSFSRCGTDTDFEIAGLEMNGWSHRSGYCWTGKWRTWHWRVENDGHHFALCRFTVLHFPSLWLHHLPVLHCLPPVLWSSVIFQSFSSHPLMVQFIASDCWIATADFKFLCTPTWGTQLHIILWYSIIMAFLICALGVFCSFAIVCCLFFYKGCLQDLFC